MGLKVEIGPGESPVPGYDVYVDTRHIPIPGGRLEMRQWGSDLLPFEDGSVDLIRAKSVLEHIPFPGIPQALKEAYRVLADKGVMWLQLPDVYEICRRLHEGQIDGAHAVWLLYGGQDYPDNFHKTGFTKDMLTRALLAAGFRRVEFDENFHTDMIARARK